MRSIAILVCASLGVLFLSSVVTAGNCSNGRCSRVPVRKAAGAVVRVAAVPVRVAAVPVRVAASGVQCVRSNRSAARMSRASASCGRRGCR